MTEQEFISIFEEIESHTESIKAEVLLAELLQNSSMTLDDVIIKNQSSFNRSYRNDLILLENVDNQFEKFAFHLSRNGIYDLVPEGLFHSENKKNTGESYNSKRKEIKNTEQDARRFFAPIENEFFHQKLEIEKNERKMLNSFYSLEEQFLMDFWKIDTQIQKKILVKLMRLLPNSHQIAGDLELTRLSAEKILGERVVFKKKFQAIKIKNRNKKNKGVILGNDTILGDEEHLFFEPVLEVTIGPVKSEKANNFVQKNATLEFMELFYDFFIPLEYKVLTNIEIIKNESFKLGTHHYSTMGLTTTI